MFQILFPKISVDQYNQQKECRYFQQNSVKLCEDCYLDLIGVYESHLCTDLKGEYTRSEKIELSLRTKKHNPKTRSEYQVSSLPSLTSLFAPRLLKQRKPRWQLCFSGTNEPARQCIGKVFSSGRYFWREREREASCPPLKSVSSLRGPCLRSRQVHWQLVSDLRKNLVPLRFS